MRLVLYQPDIAHNVGAAIRAAACFEAGVDIIGPCGFPLGARDVRRVAMDYAALAPPALHDSWTAFEASPQRAGGRLILFTTKAARPLWSFQFRDSDLLLMGRESAGAPADIHEAADARLFIPIAETARSLNVTVAAAVAMAEARRQMHAGGS